MTILHGSSEWTVFLVDGFDMLSAKPKGVTFAITAAQERTDGLGDRIEAMTPVGLSKLTLTQVGAFWDTSPGSIHALGTAPPAVRTVTLCPAGSTPGAPSLIIRGVYTVTYDVIATVGALTKGNITYQVNGPAGWGSVVSPLGVHTANWDTTTTPSDNGAPTTTGAIATLTVTAIVGTTTVTVKHSPDGTTFTDLVVFDPVAAAPTVQQKTVSGTVNRYLAVTGTVSASGSATVTVSVQRT